MSNRTALRPPPPSDSIMRFRWMQVAVLMIISTSWGGAFSLSRYALTHGVPPMGYGVCVFTGAALIALAIAWARGRLPRLLPDHLRFNVICGVTRIGGPSTVIFFVVQHIQGGLMAMLIATGSLMTYSMALAIGRERFTLLRFAGILCGLAGVALIVLPSSSLPDRSQLVWVLIGFGAPVFYATSNITTDRYRPPGSDTIALVAGQLVVGAAWFFPLAALVGGGFYVPFVHPSPVDFVILLHALINGICFIGVYEVIRHAGPVVASQGAYLTTIAGVLWGVALLGERHSPYIWAALVMILGGVALVNLRPRAAKRETE